jgi:hypothetical protein
MVLLTKKSLNLLKQNYQNDQEHPKEINEWKNGN